MSLQHPFHLAFPVRDLNEARHFYGTVLGCPEGRSSAEWIDFNFFGHQIVTHLSSTSAPRISNVVDHHDVPVPHFGVVLDMEEWKALAARLRSQCVKFVMEPQIRFVGEPGEQGTFFLLDPSGNALEFKAMKNRANLFAK